MKQFGTALAIVICLALGFAAGYKSALVREHSRLERNKQIISRMLTQVWSNPDTNSALKVADQLFTPDFVLHDCCKFIRFPELAVLRIVDEKVSQSSGTSRTTGERTFRQV